MVGTLRGEPWPEERVALVTGGASGIGRAITQRLTAAGVRVTVADLDSDGAGALAAELDTVSVVRCDVASPADCRTAVADVLEREGRLDILVSNAGLQHVAPITEFPEEQWDRILAVILSAAFHLAKAALPGMYERSYGRILNVSSMLGIYAAPYKPAYVAAKHGLNGLTKEIALEAAPHGVTCNALCPAYVRTPLVEKQIAAQAQTHGISEEQVVEQVMINEPAIKRLLEPDEVAAMAMYLVSDDASFVTGSMVRLDGGWSAR
jgi:3-hydroxybutyrate dehydrogenase